MVAVCLESGWMLSWRLKKANTFAPEEGQCLMTRQTYIVNAIKESSLRPKATASSIRGTWSRKIISGWERQVGLKVLKIIRIPVEVCDGINSLLLKKKNALKIR